MTKLQATLKVLIVICFTLAVASVTQAQATRTWVSGVGDDANPCSRTAPCKTFAGAISKTAANGEIDCIDPGGFGAVTITKGITIDGGGTFGSILASLTNGIIINDSAVVPTAVVTIRNLSINGAGNGLNGIRILKAKKVHVENVEIFGFTGNGIEVALTAIASGGTFMYFDDVDIRNLTGALSIGIRLSSPSSATATTMDHVRVQGVTTGIQAGAFSNLFVRNSVVVDCTTGIDLVVGAGGSRTATIENTFLTDNGTALNAGTGSTAFLSQSTITACGTGIAAGGGVVQSSGNNRILGNASDGLTPTIILPK